MVSQSLLASAFVLLFCTSSTLAQGANHANVHHGWTSDGGPYFCGSGADGDGPAFLAAVMNPQCGATIWVKNTGTFGTSVDNGVGNCIEATLVDQEGGGSVDLNPAAWAALSKAPDGQVSVDWGYGSCSGGDSSPAPAPASSPAPATAPSVAPSSAPSTPQDQTEGGGCTVQANDQCGGQDFTGCTACADGLQCTVFNNFWSDCKPPGFVPSRIRRGVARVRNL